MVKVVNSSMVSKRIKEECKNHSYVKVGIRFRGKNNICKYAIYDTDMDKARPVATSFSQWELSMWDAFIERAETYYGEHSALNLDRIDAIILTPAKGPEITIIV